MTVAFQNKYGLLCKYISIIKRPQNLLKPKLR